MDIFKIKENIQMLDIETKHTKSKPTIKIRDDKRYQFQVSLSHDKKIAVAVVISFDVKKTNF